MKDEWMQPPKEATHPRGYTRVGGVGYRGVGVSNNQFYQSKSFHVRNRIKDKYHEIFSVLLAEQMPKKGLNLPISDMHLSVGFRSRHDVDNVVGLVKLFVDTLVNRGYLVDDNKNHFTSLEIKFRPEFPHNCFLFEIFEKKLIGKS